MIINLSRKSCLNCHVGIGLAVSVQSLLINSGEDNIARATQRVSFLSYLEGVEWTWEALFELIKVFYGCTLFLALGHFENYKKDNGRWPNVTQTSAC